MKKFNIIVYVALFTMMLGEESLFAFTLDEGMQKELKEAKKVGMTFDYSDLLINGDSPEEFVQEYGDEKGVSESDLADELFSLIGLVYKYPAELLTPELRTQVEFDKDREFLSRYPEQFNVRVRIKSFTTNGGFDAEVLLYTNDPYDNYKFSLTSQDGKGKDDMTLMKEGAAKLGAMIVAQINMWISDGFPEDLTASK